VVDDLLAIHSETNKLFPDMPKILLGHSMGSWIGLSALQQKNIFDAACFLVQVIPILLRLFCKNYFLK
jgi:alpha-beta hydrolase superfamily lysophospholipase